MAFVILLILAYGPLNWTFPWWVWALGLLSTSTPFITVKNTPQITVKCTHNDSTS